MRIAIIVTVMTATIMQVLDATIANVALPHIQATVGATQEAAAWILTSYIMATAIATPLTGWLEGKFGRRRLMLLAVAGFVIASVACALAPTLSSIVIARILQGAFGAFIAPIGQAILIDTSPPEKRPQALTIMGMGIMVAPMLGPMIGGFLTETFDWRWVFLINVPIGVGAFIGILFCIPDNDAQERRFDMVGFGLLAVSLAALQLLVDRGTQLDWLQSTEIIAEILICIAAFWMFVIHSRYAREPVFQLDVFRDRNFVIANFFMALIAGLSFAGAALMTPMLQNLLGYNAADAGLTVAPRGAAMLVSMLVAGRLINSVGPRILVGVGLAICAAGQYMMAGFNLEMGRETMMIALAVQGFGAGFLLTPLQVLAFVTLPAHLRTDAAAVIALTRSIGGAIAISVCVALLAHNIQVSHSDLAIHITGFTKSLLSMGMVERMGVNSELPAQLIDMEINRQAAMIAYINDYWLMGWACLLTLPLVLILKRPRGADGQPQPMMAD